eukprot:TRINITY_DN1198_c0_g3_i1.p1 TRINITY_DN1198_c0_g3~~TRINITY_DN1198_c0_g3_i1.p1  ORF type:complete len:314 (-),score=72.91 TRINITY_DN1198_c0_g3_i1:645-1586(-)
MGGASSKKSGQATNNGTKVVVQTRTAEVSEVQVHEVSTEPVAAPPRFSVQQHSHTPSHSPSPTIETLPNSNTSPLPPSTENQPFTLRSVSSATPHESSAQSQAANSVARGASQKGMTVSVSPVPSSHSNSASAVSQPGNRPNTNSTVKANLQKAINKDEEYNAPGYIEPTPVNEPKVPSFRQTNDPIIKNPRDDALLIDLSPRDAPRNAQQDQGYRGGIDNQTNSQKQNLNRDVFDSEKFRQANARKTNQSRDYDYDSSKPQVARPPDRPTGHTKFDDSNADPQKPKFMGPTKQFISPEDELMLEEILETTAA